MFFWISHGKENFFQSILKIVYTLPFKIFNDLTEKKINDLNFRLVIVFLYLDFYKIKEYREN